MAKTDVSTPTTQAWIDAGSRRLVFERTFNAPRALVFKAFTDPERLSKWWGPREWPTTTKELDLRPGGRWHYCMTGPDGTESWVSATYKEISPIEKIVYIDAFADADGNENNDMPSMLVTFNFEDVGGSRTRLVSTTEFASSDDLKQLAEMGMVEGWSESLDKLEELLAA